MRKVLVIQIVKSGKVVLESTLKSPDQVVGSLGFIDDATEIKLFQKEIEVEK